MSVEKEPMAPGKKLVLVCVVLIAALGGGYGFSFVMMKKELGAPVYTPKMHIEEMRRSRDTEEKVALKTFMGGAFGICALAMVVVVVRSQKSPAIDDLHGSARWAKLDEIRKSKLLDDKGVYVGGLKSGKLLLHLRDDSNTHLLCFAPTRSGKGVSLILPTLLTNQDKSFFCYDIKGENYSLTSGWREAAGNRIVKLELASPNSHKYNPLDEIIFGSPTFTQDVQNLATILTSRGDGKNQSDHWESKARELLSALIIYTLEDDSRERSLYYVGNLLTDPEKDVDETLEHLIETCEHEDAKNILASTKNTPDKERGSVISTLQKTFELFKDPVIRENTSSSDFTINDLVNGETPLSLYFIVQPNDLTRLSTMVRVFVTQLLNKLICGMEFEAGSSRQKNKHQLILMLDEFASMRYMPIIEEGLAYIAGYGVRAYLIVQDLDQITKYYGKENGVIGNCHTQIAFAPNSNQTAMYLSQQLGKKTIVRRKISRSVGKSNSKSISVDELGRELLTAEETRRLKGIDLESKTLEGGETLIMRSGEHPIKGTRILYFRNETFAARSKMPPARITQPENPKFIEKKIA